MSKTIKSLDEINKVLEDISVIETGTYTPSASNLVNITSITPFELRYIRIGNMVNVFGLFEIEITTASVYTNFQINLPFSSSITTTEQVGGSFVGVHSSFKATADVTNNKAKAIGTPEILAAAGFRTFSANFWYEIA